jgi:uncharacterized Zn finger protein
MSQSSPNCGKEAYRTWSAALRVIKRMQRVERLQGRTIHGQQPYRCQECGAVHLTSHSYNKKRKAA